MERVPIQSILCPVDFSEFSIRAYDYACSLAQHTGAALFVEYVVELWRYPSVCFAPTANQYDEFCRHLRIAAEAQLRNFVQQHPPNGVVPQCVIREGMATDCILSFAEKEGAGLIVMGTHGIRGFDRLMLGSATEKVLRTAHCSVLAVHRASRKLPHGEPTQRGIELREILFCTDFSEFANRAFDYALSVAADYNASLTVVHVVEGISRLRCAENAAKAHECLEQLVAAQRADMPGITTVVRSGRAYKEISQLAYERDADLVIMAVRGSNALDDRIFGSTTYRVVQLGNCPVLAVHPHD